MATITEDLAAWGEILQHQTTQLRAIPDIETDELEQGYAVESADELVAKYMGALTVVISGPDMTIVDHDIEPVYTGPLQATGIFNGSAIFAEGSNEVEMGYYIAQPIIDEVDTPISEAIKKSAKYVFGSAETANIWAPDDIFNGCANISLPDCHEASAQEADRISQVELAMDLAVLNGPLNIDNITAMFKDKVTIRDGLELGYFLRRLNALVNPECLKFHIEAAQLFRRDRLDGEFRPTIEPDTQVSLIVHSGSLFTLMEDKDGERLLSLIAPYSDESGYIGGFHAINLDDVVSISAEIV